MHLLRLANSCRTRAMGTCTLTRAWDADFSISVQPLKAKAGLSICLLDCFLHCKSCQTPGMSQSCCSCHWCSVKALLLHILALCQDYRLQITKNPLSLMVACDLIVFSSKDRQQHILHLPVGRCLSCPVGTYFISQYGGYCDTVLSPDCTSRLPYPVKIVASPATQ